MADGTIAAQQPEKGRVSEAEWRARVDLAALVELRAEIVPYKDVELVRRAFELRFED